MAREQGWVYGVRVLLALLGAALSLNVAAMFYRGIVNVGVLVPAVFALAALLLAWRWQAVMRWRNAYRWRRWCWHIGCTLVVLWLMSLAVFFWKLDQLSAHEPDANRPVQAIVILGSGSPNCTPSGTLEARLDEGLIQARRWPSARVVVSGGVGLGTQCSEASLMSHYLTYRGLPVERLILEDRSTSTETNLRNSRDLLAQAGIDASAPMLLVSSDYHLIRAGRIARKAGFTDMQGVAAQTPRYLRYNAWLREYFATFSSWLLGEY